MARTIAKDHDDKRQHILHVAAQVFAQAGIARASMNDVAAACGISKANIYHYYTSKNNLLFDILDNYLSQLHGLISGTDRSHMDAPTRLRAITHDFLMAYEGMDNEHKIQSEGMPYLPAHQQKILKNHQRALVGLVADVLRDCAPKALGQDAVRCRDVTMAVFGMMNWFYMWNPNATQQARKDYAATIADLTLNGVSKA